MKHAQEEFEAFTDKCAAEIVAEQSLPSLNGSEDLLSNEGIISEARNVGFLGDVEIDWYRGVFFDDDSDDNTIYYSVKSHDVTPQLLCGYRKSLEEEILCDSVILEKVMTLLCNEYES